MSWYAQWPPLWVAGTSFRSALGLRLEGSRAHQAPQPPVSPYPEWVRAQEGQPGAYAPVCVNVSFFLFFLVGVINSTEPAICRAQRNLDSSVPDKHHGTQHPGRRRAGSEGRCGAGVRGRARPMTGLRCASSARVRWVRRLYARPPARPRSTLQSRPLVHLPQFPSARAPLSPKVPAPTQCPSPLSRARRKGKGLQRQVSAARQPLAAPPGPELRHASRSLRTPRFARAEEEQSCS